MNILWFGLGWFVCGVMFVCIDVWFRWKKKTPSEKRLEASEKLKEMLNGRYMGVRGGTEQEMLDTITANKLMRQSRTYQIAQGRQFTQEEWASAPRGEKRAWLMRCQLHGTYSYLGERPDPYICCIEADIIPQAPLSK